MYCVQSLFSVKIAIEDNSSFCALLTYIYPSQLRNLKGWCNCSKEEISRGCSHQSQSIEYLSIDDCYKLVSIPQHTYIKKVTLRKVTEKILKQVVNYSKVEYLQMFFMLNLKSLSGVFQHLSTLCELRIRYCEEFDPCNDEDGC
ncbi:putative leucine-rich repeat domain, L domain-containing protein [Medicago truncatula]|uniref:Putative leucine-rich repeat domain, L domain-containing protein n=1 Tax=Medicago truncatula TaxID=3880 RepID=A0A396I312_MEDTR|nr:putative leucine-rich repeat domain, L domain-containing protein [Medicago truncatula]